MLLKRLRAILLWSTLPVEPDARVRHLQAADGVQAMRIVEPWNSRNDDAWACDRVGGRFKDVHNEDTTALEAYIVRRVYARRSRTAYRCDTNTVVFEGQIFSVRPSRAELHFKSEIKELRLAAKDALKVVDDDYSRSRQSADKVSTALRYVRYPSVSLADK